MQTLTDLTARIVAFRDERDWKQFHTPKDMAISLVLEAAEVIEHFQWKSHEEFKEHLEKNKAELSGELVDVLYWVLLMAHDLDIDLEQAFSEKMAKNAQKYPVEKSGGNHKKYTELAQE